MNTNTGTQTYTNTARIENADGTSQAVYLDDMTVENGQVTKVKVYWWDEKQNVQTKNFRRQADGTYRARCLGRTSSYQLTW